MGPAIRNIVAVLALLFLVGILPDPLAASADPNSCDEVCNSSVPCDTPCRGTTYEEPPETICGNHLGGSSAGYCQASCGDGACDYANGENGDTCEADCVLNHPHGAFIRCPEDGIDWCSRAGNLPNQDSVNHCYGNCGPGCNWYDAPIPICGTPDQYWQLSILTPPQVSYENTCFCADGNNLVECGERTTYTALAEWRYHGWKAAGCYTHDTTCRTNWIASFVIGLAGVYAAPGWWWAVGINLLVNPLINCKIDFASFA